MADSKKAKAEELPPQDAAGDDVAPETAGKKFNAKKIILFGLLPLLLLGGSGAGAYFMGYFDSFLPQQEIDCSVVKEGDPDHDTCVAQAEEKAAAEAAANLPGVFIPVPDMIVNLNSTSRQPRFLKVSLQVELADATQQQPFETVLPRIVDQFQTYLRELRVEDLRGSSGMYRMKLELLTRVKAAAPDIKVRDVLFQEILVQ